MTEKVNIKNLSKVLNEEYLPKFLFGWVVLGYILGFDFFQYYSCIVGPDHISDNYNIIFTITSLTLIGFIINSENVKLKKVAIILEIIVWVFKLMIFKGGYEWSFDPSYIFHDLASMAIRLLLACYLFEVKNLFSLKIILLCTFIFIIKFNVFAHPLALDYAEYKSIQEAKKYRNKIIGSWDGHFYTFKYENYKYTHEKFPTKIVIDSSFIFFEKIPHLQPQYSFIRNYSHYGYLSSPNDSLERQFVIQKITDDSLVLDIYNFHTEYLFKLERKND